MRNIAAVIRVLFFILFVCLILQGRMMFWLALFTSSLIGALLFGRIYCGYVCPMNTLMMPTEWLSKKLKLQKDNAPKWLRSGKFALFALGASVIVMLLARKMLKTDLPILLIWLVISVVITMRYEPAVFHNFICPFGALLKASGKYAVLSKRIIKEKCIGCRLCEKVCPADAVAVNTADKKAVINRVLCLQCSNCQRICPEDAICYGKQKNVPKAAES